MTEQYPVTAALRKQLGEFLDLEELGALEDLGCQALEYIGEYEHGSADIAMMLPAAKREDAMSDNEDVSCWMMSERDLLQFAADTLKDFLVYAQAQEA